MSPWRVSRALLVPYRPLLNRLPSRLAAVWALNPRRNMSQNFDSLAALVDATRADIEKAEAGNKAACTRVRKSMQDLKNLAQEIRKEMLENRDAGK